MAFPTSQQLYNVNFFTDAWVSVETEAHRAHVRRQKRIKKRTCGEQNRDLSACAHDAHLWALKPTHR
jgi:hypothetical protein